MFGRGCLPASPYGSGKECLFEGIALIDVFPHKHLFVEVLYGLHQVARCVHRGEEHRTALWVVSVCFDFINTYGVECLTHCENCLETDGVGIDQLKVHRLSPLSRVLMSSCAIRWNQRTASNASS